MSTMRPPMAARVPRSPSADEKGCPQRDGPLGGTKRQVLEMMAAVVKACARRPQNGRTNCAPRIDVRAEVAGTAPSAETVRPARSRPGAVLGPSKETARRLLREARWTPGGGQALRRRAARCPR